MSKAATLFLLLALGKPLAKGASVGTRCVECEARAERQLLPWLESGGRCACGGQEIYERPGETPEQWQNRRAERRRTP